eukprot:58136-Chlamydomonas_euryale.AAC.2
MDHGYVNVTTDASMHACMRQCMRAFKHAVENVPILQLLMAMACCLPSFPGLEADIEAAAAAFNTRWCGGGGGLRGSVQPGTPKQEQPMSLISHLSAIPEGVTGTDSSGVTSEVAGGGGGGTLDLATPRQTPHTHTHVHSRSGSPASGCSSAQSEARHSGDDAGAAGSGAAGVAAFHHVLRQRLGAASGEATTMATATPAASAPHTFPSRLTGARRAHASMRGDPDLRVRAMTAQYERALEARRQLQARAAEAHAARAAGELAMCTFSPAVLRRSRALVAQSASPPRVQELGWLTHEWAAAQEADAGGGGSSGSGVWPEEAHAADKLAAHVAGWLAAEAEASAGTVVAAAPPPPVVRLLAAFDSAHDSPTVSRPSKVGGACVRHRCHSGDGAPLSRSSFGLGRSTSRTARQGAAAREEADATAAAAAALARLPPGFGSPGTSDALGADVASRLFLDAARHEAAASLRLHAELREARTAREFRAHEPPPGVLASPLPPGPRVYDAPHVHAHRCGAIATAAAACTFTPNTNVGRAMRRVAAAAEAGVQPCTSAARRQGLASGGGDSGPSVLGHLSPHLDWSEFLVRQSSAAARRAAMGRDARSDGNGIGGVGSVGSTSPLPRRPRAASPPPPGAAFSACGGGRWLSARAAAGAAASPCRAARRVVLPSETELTFTPEITALARSLTGRSVASLFEGGRAARDARLEAMRAHRAARDAARATFRPDLSATAGAFPHIGPRLPVRKQVAGVGVHIWARRQAQLRAARAAAAEAAEAEEMAACTFVPVTTPVPGYLIDPDQPTGPWAAREPSRSSDVASSRPVEGLGGRGEEPLEACHSAGAGDEGSAASGRIAELARRLPVQLRARLADALAGGALGGSLLNEGADAFGVCRPNHGVGEVGDGLSKPAPRCSTTLAATMHSGDVWAASGVSRHAARSDGRIACRARDGRLPPPPQPLSRPCVHGCTQEDATLLTGLGSKPGAFSVSLNAGFEYNASLSTDAVHGDLDAEYSFSFDDACLSPSAAAGRGSRGCGGSSSRGGSAGGCISPALPPPVWASSLSCANETGDGGDVDDAMRQALRLLQELDEYLGGNGDGAATAAAAAEER